MKSTLVLALALAGLPISAAAQAYPQPKVKHSAGSRKEERSQPRAKVSVPRSTSQQELRRIETAHTAASRKAAHTKPARPAPVAIKEDSNTPINAGGGGAKKFKGARSQSSAKRLRHKGSHH